jgi:hypothetical protein
MQATLEQKAVGGGGTTAFVSFDEFNADDDDNGWKDDHSDSFITLSSSLESAFGGDVDVAIGIDVVVTGKMTGVGGTSLSRRRTSSTRPELLGSKRLALRFSRQGLRESSLSELEGSSLGSLLLCLSAVLRVRLAIVTKSTEGFLPYRTNRVKVTHMTYRALRVKNI